MIKHRDFANSKWLYLLINFIGICILAGTLIKIFYLVANITSFSIMFSGPNEVRDYVSFRLANLILEGKNPYSLAMLTELNVPFMCLYTVLYPFLVALMCKITGISILAGYYLVNIMLVLATVYNIWIMTKEYFDSNKVLYFLCIFLVSQTFFSLIGLPTLNFHTDTIGIFISTVIMLIVKKHESRTMWLAICTVLLIFTKQILVVLFLPLFVYYWIRNKSLALKYFRELIAIGFLTLILVQLLFPLYWTETIYAQFLVSKNYGDFHDAITNIQDFYSRYSVFGLMIALGFIIPIVLGKKTGYITHWSQLKKSFKNFVDKEYFAIYLILNIVFGSLFLLYFAKCGGDGYKYCQDLLAPSWLLLCLYMWNAYLGKFWKISPSRIIYKHSVLVLVLCIATVTTCKKFSFVLFDKKDAQTYINLDRVISDHSSKTRKIYLGMNTSQYLTSRNLWEVDTIWFNDGQIEYFKYGEPEKKWISCLFYNKEILKAANDYCNRVNSMVQNKEFPMIALCIDNVIDYKILQENYYVYNTYNIKTEVNGEFSVSVWLPK